MAVIYRQRVILSPIVIQPGYRPLRHIDTNQSPRLLKDHTMINTQYHSVDASETLASNIQASGQTDGVILYRSPGWAGDQSSLTELSSDAEVRSF